MFREYGIVIDVFVPLTKAKDGKCFGFVRFKGVSEVEILERRLRDIRVGYIGIFIKLARFHRPAVTANKVGVPGVERRTYHVRPAWKTLTPSLLAGGKGYDEPVADQGTWMTNAPFSSERKRIVVNGSEDEELKWLEQCAVGCVKDPDLLNDIQFLLHKGGFLNVIPKYIGGLHWWTTLHT